MPLGREEAPFGAMIVELRVSFFSFGYFFGFVLLSCGVIAPLAWTAVRRKFLKGKYYRRA